MTDTDQIPPGTPEDDGADLVPPPEPVVIDADGVYPDLTDAQYHGDPVPGGSLSSSGARRLLPPSCPALFQYERVNGRPPKRTFDLGHAAHARVLGRGAQTEVVMVTAKDGTKTPAGDYRTNSAKAHLADIRAAGNTPILEKEDAVVTAMTARLRENETAAKLLDPDGGGLAEVSLFWTDPAHDGTVCRVRLDWMPSPAGDGRLIVPDYKTTTSAAPGAIRKAVGDYGYHVQDAWYRRVIAGLGLCDPDDLGFVFIFQEKTPPFLVTVAQVDPPALRAGFEACDVALDTYVRCERSGIWPGYTDEVAVVSLSPWVLDRHLDPAE